jgi:hypothetical protein
MNATPTQPLPATPRNSSAFSAGTSELLSERLEALRRRHVSVALLTGLAILSVVTLELLALAMFLDWWLELPWGLRLISLAAQLAVGGFIAWQSVLRPLIYQPGQDELALMVEKGRPEFRTRLIAATQLSRAGALEPGISPALIAALVAETEQLARASDFRQLVSTERLKKFALLAVLVPCLGLVGFAAGREVCTDLLRRVFLSQVPVPRKTGIVVPEGDRIVGIGDTVLLDVYVRRGVLPANGRIEINYRSRRAQQFPLEQDRDEPLHFGRVLENVQDSFSYRFVLGDAVSQTHQVRAVPRPTVANIVCEQDFPAYTGLKPATRALGDLSLLAGSTLRLRMTASKDLQSASLHLVGNNSVLALTKVPETAREFTGQFQVPTKGLTGFQVQMLDVEDMESRDDAIYRVDILPDKPPQVRLTYPERKEELVTRIATMLLAFEASDDFRLARVRLKYKTDAVERGAEKVIELDLGEEAGAAQRLRRRHDWKLPETLPGIPEGSTIEYWIEVEDNNNVTGPGISSSEHQLAKVVSDAEKRADLLNRAGDYLGSISEVAADQERLNQSLGRIIKAKAGLP